MYRRLSLGRKADCFCRQWRVASEWILQRQLRKCYIIPLDNALDQQLYLTMNLTTTGTQATNPITTDWNGEMQNSGHSIALTAVPLAFKANQLQINNGTQTGVLKFNTVANSPVITLPDATGTVCLVSGACGFETTTGTDFIQNQVASLQQANFRVQSAASNKIAGEIDGASGQSVDISISTSMAGLIQCWE